MIEKVKLKNWKSHHENELEFEKGVNALIGTMGSGKSSVMEAVVYGLFGTTPSNRSGDVKLGDLVRRTPSKAEEAEVEIDFEVNDQNYSVLRRIKDGGTERSELRKNGELIEAPATTEVTEQVEKLLGLDFKSFTRAIYSEQNNLDLFLNMRAGERKERIDELLKIDRFEDARKTTVKLENNLKKELDQKQEQLENLKENIDEEELGKLKKQIKDKREEREEIELKLEKLDEKIEQKESELKKIKNKKEEAEKLEKKKTKLKTRKESAEEELEELEEKLEGFENPEKQLEKALEKKETLENLEEQIKELKNDKKYLDRDIEDLKEEEEELEEEVEKYKQIEKVNDKLEGLEERVESLKKKGNSKHTERKNLEESIEKLTGSQEECPTCGQELDEEHRDKIISERKQEVRDLKSSEKELKQKIKEKKNKLEKLEQKKEKLLGFKSSGEKLKETQEKLSEKEEKLEELEKQLKEKQEKFSEEKLEKVEEKIEKLESLEELEDKEKNIEHLKKQLEETEEDLEELDFDEEKLEDLRDEISEKKEESSKLKQKNKSIAELLEEKEKRKKEMEKRVDEKLELEKKVENLDSVLDYVHSYKEGLKKTQLELRQNFVQKLNSLMDEIWSQVYPYDDYYSLRLNAEQDYAVEVLDSENNWISAEAEVSGGERHSAALVMRLGLSYTLSPKIDLLMLDEPTHNMDSSAVEKLAKTLRENSGDLIDQLFLVTHDPSLEAAATGKLYQLEKKGTENGLTEVTEVQ